MFVAYHTEKAIADLLKESQVPANGLPFALDSDIQVFNWQPPVGSVDAIDVPVGLYVFFSDSDFDAAGMSQKSIDHEPQIYIDAYVTAPAEQTPTDPYIFGIDNVHRKCWSYIISAFNVISHAQFKDAVERKLDDAGCNSGIAELVISKVKTMGVVEIRNAMRPTKWMRFIIGAGITESRGLEVGIPQEDSVDFVVPYRKEEDYGE